jgi:alkanesulfonate monooxygenase SsuD/methylene tetrahydromethanopterin reductase-like flavin-dependent oxidoreductase (luciferase family)
MPPIEFGFVMPGEFAHGQLPGDYVPSLNRALERIGGRFHSAWMVDHLQFGDAGVLEGFSSVAYMAGMHPNLSFGNIVTCQSFRNPALLAKMAATLQLLTGGRFILGLGAGWHEEEYRAYGYEFPPNAVRVEQLEEAVRIIRALWTGEPATFVGRYYQVHEARCEPHPDPRPPIIVGASKPKMLRLTARYADGWDISSSGPTRYRRAAGEFERACIEEGRNPEDLLRSWSGGLACAATQAAAEALAGDRFSAQAQEDDFGFVGTPEQIVEQMQSFIELGTRRFILDCAGFPDLTGLDLVLNEVLPALQS